MRANEGMLAVMIPTWISTRLSGEKFSVKRVQERTLVRREENVHHDLQIEQIPSRVFGIDVNVAEVDAICGGHDGSAQYI